MQYIIRIENIFKLRGYLSRRKEDFLCLGIILLKFIYSINCDFLIIIIIIILLLLKHKNKYFQIIDKLKSSLTQHIHTKIISNHLF